MTTRLWNSYLVISEIEGWWVGRVCGRENGQR